MYLEGSATEYEEDNEMQDGGEVDTDEANDTIFLIQKILCHILYEAPALDIGEHQQDLTMDFWMMKICLMVQAGLMRIWNSLVLAILT